MQPQSDTALPTVQPAHAQLAHIETIVVQKIQQAHDLSVRVSQLQAESNRLLESVRHEKAARIHAQRMQAAVELRLDDLDTQNSDLVILLNGLIEAIEMPASSDREVVLSVRLKAAKDEIALYAAAEEEDAA